MLPKNIPFLKEASAETVANATLEMLGDYVDQDIVEHERKCALYLSQLSVEYGKHPEKDGPRWTVSDAYAYHLGRLEALQEMKKYLD